MGCLHYQFVLKMKIFPNVTVIDDTTGGRGGVRNDFKLPNGWICTFPTTQTLLADFFNGENGISTDITIGMDPRDEALGIDNILEKAFEIIQ